MADIENIDGKSLVDSIVDWVMEEVQASGLLIWESINEEQAERIKETVVSMVTLIIMAAYNKEKREVYLQDIQGALNSLNADAALATIKAQDAVRGAFQKVVLMFSGKIFD